MLIRSLSLSVRSGGGSVLGGAAFALDAWWAQHLEHNFLARIKVRQSPVLQSWWSDLALRQSYQIRSPSNSMVWYWRDTNGRNEQMMFCCFWWCPVVPLYWVSLLVKKELILSSRGLIGITRSTHPPMFGDTATKTTQSSMAARFLSPTFMENIYMIRSEREVSAGREYGWVVISMVMGLYPTRWKRLPASSTNVA